MIYGRSAKGGGSSWASVRFVHYPSLELHDPGLKTYWLFSSNQVILGPRDKKSHSLPEETGQQDETQNVSSEKKYPGLWQKLKSLARLWWVFQQRRINLILQLPWWWHQTSGTKWERLNKANCMYLLFIFLSYLHLHLTKHGMLRDLGWITSS